MRGIRYQNNIELDVVTRTLTTMFDTSRDLTGDFLVRSALVHTPAGIENLLTPLCQRRLRQLPLDISVATGGEWCLDRAEAFLKSWS